MNDVTRLLSAIEQGDPSAAEQLLPLVYDELRRLAAEEPRQAELVSLRFFSGLSMPEPSEALGVSLPTA